MSQKAAAPTGKVTVDTLMQRALEVPGLLSLAAGFTDNEVLPREEVLAIVEHLLRDPEGAEVLQYGTLQGRPGLRRALSDHILERDHAAGARPTLEERDVIVTNGSQQALYLAVQSICEKGDIVLVEAPTYFVFLDLLAEQGVRAVSMPAVKDRVDVDAIGGFLDGLEQTEDIERVRAVYLVSYFSNPSCVSLENERKVALLHALRERGLEVPVLEDIAYRELWFDRPWPAPSLLEHTTDEMPVAVFGTMTKTFSTGIKIGYGAVPDDRLRRQMLDHKRGHDFGTGNFAQAIVERALTSGLYERELERIRPHYAHKCAVLDEALERHGLRELGWNWDRSAGGLYIWLTAPEGLSAAGLSPFFEACLEEKVLYVPGELCYAGDDGARRVRLSHGYLDEARLPEAAERFVRAARRFA